MSMRSERHTERGAAALMVAGSLVFLFGMAALAVDTSGVLSDGADDADNC